MRTNRGTWLVPQAKVPAVSHFLHDVLPNEAFDPQFRGQCLITRYFDDPKLILRAARARRDEYLTLRLRCYESGDEGQAYAVSAKTEKEKWRRLIDQGTAYRLVAQPERWA